VFRTTYAQIIKKILRGLVSLLFLTAIVLPASLARAQTPPVIDQLQIDIWPEYDRPEALVIYHIVLAPDVTLPAKLSLRLPKSSGGPANLAMKDTQGLLYNLDYTTSTPAGDWMSVNFTAPTAEVQLEYYDPGLKRSGSHRAYAFTWPGDYAVNSLTMSVQQPANATNLKANPAMGAGRLAQDGFYYYTALLGAVKAGSLYLLQLDYDKADDALSSTSQPVEPVLPVNAATTGRTTLTAMMPLLLGVLGGLLIIGGAVWFWQTGRMKKVGSARRHAHAAGGLKNSRTVVFCHQCGREANRNDVYCRSCGTRLRIPES
jgi:hypothetical protein